jgi:hypothetical protein
MIDNDIEFHENQATCSQTSSSRYPTTNEVVVFSILLLEQDDSRPIQGTPPIDLHKTGAFRRWDNHQLGPWIRQTLPKLNHYVALQS